MKTKLFIALSMLFGITMSFLMRSETIKMAMAQPKSAHQTALEKVRQAAQSKSKKSCPPESKERELRHLEQQAKQWRQEEQDLRKKYTSYEALQKRLREQEQQELEEQRRKRKLQESLPIFGGGGFTDDY